MNTKVFVSLIVLLMVIGSIFLTAGIIKAQEKGTMDETAVSAQLQQVIQNQQLIISKLNDIAKELEIIKIRSTVKGGATR